MAYDFNIDQVLEIAEQIERNGIKFYERMAGEIGDTSLKSLLSELAEMEREHEKIFHAMKDDLSKREKESTIFDPEGEAVLYLHALADLRVFDREAEKAFDIPEGMPEKEKTEKIFREAVRREKESIIFYTGMKELVGERLGRDKMDLIIKEEMKHVRLLTNRLL